MSHISVVQEVVTFRTVDPAGADVYHTNVMMAIGTDVAVVCAEAVPDEEQRKHLLERLNRHHKVCAPHFIGRVEPRIDAREEVFLCSCQPTEAGRSYCMWEVVHGDSGANRSK